MNSTQSTAQSEPIPPQVSVKTGLMLVVVALVISIIVAVVSARLFYDDTPNHYAGKVAGETLTIIHSSQLTYKNGAGKGKFGSATELFYHDVYQDGAWAAAAGVPQNTVSKNGNYVTQGVPMLAGYIYRISVSEATADQPARYTALAIPGKNSHGVPNGKTFFIDETGVIRASDKPDVMPDKNSAPIQ